MPRKKKAQKKTPSIVPTAHETSSIVEEETVQDENEEIIVPPQSWDELKQLIVMAAQFDQLTQFIVENLAIWEAALTLVQFSQQIICTEDSLNMEDEVTSMNESDLFPEEFVSVNDDQPDFPHSI